MVRLLEGSLFRIGNAEHSRDNESYGLTTLREDHVDVDGASIHQSRLKAVVQAVAQRLV